jgi:hypothetical protein
MYLGRIVEIADKLNCSPTRAIPITGVAGPVPVASPKAKKLAP